MELKHLFEDLEIESGVVEKNVAETVGISGMTANSSKVQPGFLFICLVGTKTDGHKYIVEALENGAAAVLIEHKPENINMADIPYILVKNTRSAEAKLWMRWHDNPMQGLKIIGITGTNGKTSVSYMINQILSDAGYKTALFGTIKDIIDGVGEESKLTTSDPEDMARLFRSAKDKGTEYIIMEISSHSLELDKTAGLGVIDIGVFTNLSQDHLDFHGNMINYRKAKAKLFQMCRTGVLNADDVATIDIVKTSSSDNYFYGVKNKTCDFGAENIKYRGVDGSEYYFYRKNSDEKPFKIKSHIPGEPYIYNTLAAASVGNLLGIEDKIIAEALEKVRVRGRIEKIDTDTPYAIFIDYAHTPDALENVLQSARSFTNGRIIVVFGCGGDRDRTKRPVMGKIAYENADFCVVTSDNSRTEKPIDIIGDILKGIPDDVSHKIITIIDREDAIKYAIDIAEADDVILLAGKGHEEYINENGEIKYFSEREIVLKYIREKAEKL